jgi:hypothetical protein
MFSASASIQVGDNLVKNGSFDECDYTLIYGNWGDVQSNGHEIPFWTVTNPSQTGLAASGSPWAASSYDVGKFALYYQRHQTETHTISQKIVVKQGGLYKISFEYMDRPNVSAAHSYEGFPFQLQLVKNAITNVIFGQSNVFNSDKVLSFTGDISLDVGEYTLQFCIPPYNTGTGTGIAFDDVKLERIGVLTAKWIGLGEIGNLLDPRNWLCKDAEENVLEGALPERYTILHFGGAFSVDVKSDVVLNGEAIVFEDGATLSADCDWSGVNIPLLGTLDIAGKEFTLSGLLGDVTITDGSLDTSNPGRLHVNVAAGKTVRNQTVSLSGNMQLIKEGSGTYVSAKVQTYTGGTIVAAGTAQPPDGTGSNDAYSGWKFPAFGTGKIIVQSGGTFDIRSNYDYSASKMSGIYLNGGVFKNSGPSMTQSEWGRSGIAALGADSYMVSDSACTHFGGLYTDLGSHTLTATLSSGKVLSVRGGITNGVFAVKGKGWLQVDGNCDMSTTTFDVSAIISLGSYTLNVRDYIVNYSGTGDNSEKETAGTGPMNVYGVFKPNTDYFYGCTMQDGSVIDLSLRTTPLPATNSFKRTSETLRKEISFAEGAVVTVKLDGRNDLKELSQSKDIETGVSNGYVLYWITKPSRSVEIVLDSVISKEYELRSTDRGLVLIPKQGLLIVIR